MKISINLLPPEVIAEELKNAKFYRVQFIGVFIVLVMIFLTSLTVALRVLQDHNIAVYKAQLTRAEERVTSLKSTQASLLLLKDRLGMIGEYLGVTSKQSLMYNLIDKLIPSSVVITAITVEKEGGTLFTVIVPDPITLDTLINNLTLKDSNEGSISQVSIEGLNRGREGLYRVNFKVNPNT